MLPNDGEHDQEYEEMHCHRMVPSPRAGSVQARRRRRWGQTLSMRPVKLSRT